jgi:Putative mono-oxygenase ydhR
MSARVLQINMKFNASGEDLQNGFAHVVNDIAAVPGLRWKVWIINEETKEAGGLYLFEGRDSVEAYLQGPLIAGLKENPAISEPSFKQFDVIEDLTAVTRGPV